MIWSRVGFFLNNNKLWIIPEIEARLCVILLDGDLYAICDKLC